MGGVCHELPGRICTKLTWPHHHLLLRLRDPWFSILHRWSCPLCLNIPETEKPYRLGQAASLLKVQPVGKSLLPSKREHPVPCSFPTVQVFTPHLSHVLCALPPTHASVQNPTSESPRRVGELEETNPRSPISVPQLFKDNSCPQSQYFHVDFHSLVIFLYPPRIFPAI